MNKKQIEMIFTDKVTKYLNDGYLFFTRSLNTSYSDCEGSVDLYKENYLIRIGLYTSHEHFYDDEILNIRTYKMELIDPSDSPWDSDMNLVEQDVYYKVADNYYLPSKEYFEGKEVREAKRQERAKNYDNRRYGLGEVIEMDDRAKKIVLPFIQRQPRCKSVKLSDIEVIKQIRPIGHHDIAQEICYRVRVKNKNKSYTLKQSFTKIH